ncbi:pyridoxamine 5'-phosphate oxidase family protein [Ruania halotolerans]|uniref:pyridoxamine 5'-phosphate oxidase family protein n=1 Tax=Ruania halotolerans TaxID=2897773 RepID=UPI001E2B8B21|nr:pyridoxamine 5'-phosphate oxidase family protein [Ruania halotolerans]UFU08263.1 pyridoxamine 5'-phosphate oxidase family protein [Ruania halotolerans]
MSRERGPRSGAQRKADVLAALKTPALDGWVATASPDGDPYLVPLSIVWAGDQVIIAVDGGSRTARNLLASAHARVGIGPTRDVVMIDLELTRTADVGSDPTLADVYAAQADWDPRGSEGYVYLVLRPTRIQAWREADETIGRTLMRDGSWSV